MSITALFHQRTATQPQATRSRRELRRRDRDLNRAIRAFVKGK